MIQSSSTFTKYSTYLNTFTFQFRQNNSKFWKHAKYGGVGLIIILVIGGMLIGYMAKTDVNKAEIDSIKSKFRAFQDIMNKGIPLNRLQILNTIEC